MPTWFRGQLGLGPRLSTGSGAGLSLFAYFPVAVVDLNLSSGSLGQKDCRLSICAVLTVACCQDQR